MIKPIAAIELSLSSINKLTHLTMSKKSTKKSNPETNQTSTNPNSPNIFNRLFGEIQDSEPSNSLFSSDNPFRRKPQILQNPKNGDSEKNPSEADQKKKKKGKERRDSLDSDLGNKPLKEPKLVHGQNPNVEKNDGSQSNLNKKKKKRKRDELEREYEAKKYGVVLDEGEGEKREEKVVVGKKRKSLDETADMRVSQEGYDDESKLLRTVFVGNLPLKMKKKGLLKEFSKFGEIESVRIRSVPTLDSKKPKKVLVINGKINEAADSVHAYVVFKTEQSAEASLAHNMSVVEGNHIRVDRACPPRKKLKEDGESTPLYSHKRTVFVGNLPFDVKDEELYQLFCGIKHLEDSIEAVRVVRDRNTSLGKGIAYVLFKTREAANLACKKHNLKIRDRELRICHAKSSTQSTPSKRKNPFQGDSESAPAKKYSSGEKTPGSRYKVNTKGGDTSYQGFRASKSGEKKKLPSRTGAPAQLRSGGKSKEKVKQRTQKRPAVAARKAKANAKAMKAGGGGGAPNHAGNKRKMDARTPQSSYKSKKAKKFK